jgi:hypothetical protein
MNAMRASIARTTAIVLMRCIVVLSLLVVSGIGFAHRGNDMLSVIEIDAATGHLLVTHHFAAHDLEPALLRIASDVQPSLDDPAAQAALIRYTGTNFSLSDGGERAVPLRFEAIKLSGDDVRLVYRGTLPLPAKTLQIDSRLLNGLYPDETHQINIRRAGITRSVLLRGGSETQQVLFE